MKNNILNILTNIIIDNENNELAAHTQILGFVRLNDRLYGS